MQLYLGKRQVNNCDKKLQSIKLIWPSLPDIHLGQIMTSQWMIFRSSWLWWRMINNKEKLWLKCTFKIFFTTKTFIHCHWRVNWCNYYGSTLSNKLNMLISVCMLSLFSRVLLFATPWTVARQDPLSMGFSRQEYWSGLPFPSPGDLYHPGVKLYVSYVSHIAGRFFSAESLSKPKLNK